MVDEPENLRLKQLAALRTEIQQGFALTHGKIGTLAESIVSLRKRVDDIAEEVGQVRLDLVGLRADVRTIAIAVDQHTTRLDHIEQRLGIGTTQN